MTAEKAEKAKDKEKAAEEADIEKQAAKEARQRVLAKKIERGAAAEEANNEKQAAVAAKKKIEEAALEAIELEKVQRAAQRAGQRADKRMRVKLEKISVNELKSRRKAALIAAVLFRPGNQFGIAKAHVSVTGYCTKCFWVHWRRDRGVADECAYDRNECHGDIQRSPQNLDEAAIWYRKAARQGHVLAQFVLGRAHMRGRGEMVYTRSEIELPRSSFETWAHV